MSQFPEYAYKLKSPNGRFIHIDDLGEHHMGAVHIEFIPSEAIHGVSRFFTTNGQLFYREEDDCFYLFDTCLLVRLNADTWRAVHLCHPEGLYCSSVRIEGDEMKMDFYKYIGRGETRSIPLAEIPWQDGLGPASAGVFPSAFNPWVEDRSRRLSR